MLNQTGGSALLFRDSWRNELLNKRTMWPLASSCVSAGSDKFRPVARRIKHRQERWGLVGQGLLADAAQGLTAFTDPVRQEREIGLD